MPPPQAPVTAAPAAAATAPAASPDRNEAFLQRLPPNAQTIVKGVANYEIDPDTITGKDREEVIAAAKIYRPDYNMTEYQKRGSPPSGEIAARIGLSKAFIERTPQIRERIQADELNSAGGRALAMVGQGGPGELRRAIDEGSEALLRGLTGAGMSANEATNYARRYQFSLIDTKETQLRKLNELENALRYVSTEVLSGRGNEDLRKGFVSKFGEEVTPKPAIKPVTNDAEASTAVREATDALKDPRVTDANRGAVLKAIHERLRAEERPTQIMAAMMATEFDDILDQYGKAAKSEFADIVDQHAEQPPSPLGKEIIRQGIDVAKQIPSGLPPVLRAIACVPGAGNGLRRRPGRKDTRLCSQPGASRRAAKLLELTKPAREGIAQYLPTPETTAGQLARTASEFIPSGVAGARRLSIPSAAGVGATAGLTSEAAGQAAEGTPYEPIARMAGGLVGGAGAARQAEAAAARTAVPSLEEGFKAAGKLYDQFRASGLNYNPNIGPQFSQAIKSELASRGLTDSKVVAQGTWEALPRAGEYSCPHATRLPQPLSGAGAHRDRREGQYRRSSRRQDGTRTAPAVHGEHTAGCAHRQRQCSCASSRGTARGE